MSRSRADICAVHIHSGWRCASTYVWSRFRALSGTTCFYEPFAERLAHLSPKRVARDTAQGWQSRHPALERPYRDEYRPLLRPLLRGVRGYRESFALERYFPTDGARHEIAYLARLLEHAAARRSVAVFGFSRSLQRAQALRAGLGGYHIVLRRSAPQQWLSCRSYRGAAEVPYFELCHAAILAQAPAQSPAGRLAASLGLPAMPRWPRWPRWPRDVRGRLQSLNQALSSWSDEQSYQVFIAVYLLGHAAATPAADMLIDVERLGSSAAYRTAVSARIGAETGLPVDFSDALTPRREAAVVGVDFAAVQADIRARLAAFGAALEPLEAPGP
ncbi:MAG: hypothetical protein ACP5P4_04375 [Steroidobacteraceae bacterium]